MEWPITAGLLQPLLADVAGDLLGDRGGDRLRRLALGVALGRGACEAGDVDAMDAVTPVQVIDRALPDGGRGRQAGDQDQVRRALGPVHAHVQPIRGEGGGAVAVRGVGHVAVLGQGGLGGGQQEGGGEGGAEQGVSPL